MTTQRFEPRSITFLATRMYTIRYRTMKSNLRYNLVRGCLFRGWRYYEEYPILRRMIHPRTKHTNDQQIFTPRESRKQFLLSLAILFVRLQISTRIFWYEDRGNSSLNLPRWRSQLIFVLESYGYFGTRTIRDGA